MDLEKFEMTFEEYRKLIAPKIKLEFFVSILRRYVADGESIDSMALEMILDGLKVEEVLK